MIKHYVEFCYPGAFFSETSVKEVTEEKPFDSKFPKGAYAYRFFDKEEIEGTTGKLFGLAFNYSGMYYKGGQVYTLAELKDLFSNESTLIRNIEGNGYKKAVITALGNWQPFTDKDTLVIE